MKRFRPLWIICVIVIFGAVYLIFFANPDIPVKKLIPRYANSNSKFAMLEGTAFHYRDEGSGYPIVLIHGFSSSLHTWDGWTKDLTNSFRVVRFDMPGYGLTGPWKGHAPTMKNYVLSVDLLVNFLGITNFALCGNSLGGRVAWEYELAHPEKVNKLILEDASGYPGPSKLSPVLKLAKYPVLSGIIKLLTNRKTVSKNVILAYADTNRFTPDLAQRYYELVMREGNRDALIERFKINDPDNSGLIRTIKTPTLIMWGMEDHLIPVENAYRFKSKITNSILIIYTNTGHLPMEESPEISVKDTISFLKKKK